MHRTLVFFYIKLKYFALISQSYAALVFCVLFLIREMRRADVPIKPSLCLISYPEMRHRNSETHHNCNDPFFSPDVMIMLTAELLKMSVFNICVGTLKPC